MAIAGFVRTRQHNFGRQSAFGTKVAAVRAYPFKGVPSVNLNWTDPDVDQGSIDPIAAPYRTAPDLTAPLTDPSLRYDNLPILLSGVFGGGVDPTGVTASKTWAYAPASDGSDDIDVYTYEFGNTDVTGDWYQFGDGIIESLEISAPDGLGALTASATWRFGSVASSGSTDMTDSPTVPTSLSIPTDDIVVYLKDAEIAIASDPADFATSKVSDALHSFVLRVTPTIDQKRFANGSQKFDPSAYAIGSRMIELECTFAKTDDIVGTGSESDAWMSDNAVNRFVQVSFESQANASTGPDVPYSWVFAMPMRYYTRTEGDLAGNVTVVLTGHAFLDPAGSDTDFGGVFTSTVVNTLATGDL
jgi:hypothetical protein